jgi:3-oxoacyl-[acyl-carrier-protein] synthase II
MSRTAVVTGVGPVSAIGTGVEAFWSSLLTGRSGTKRLERCAPPRRGCAVAAEVTDPTPRPMDVMDPEPRVVQLARRAARLAWDDASFEGDPERVGIAVGTGFGSMDLVEATLQAMHEERRISPATAFRVFNHSAACELAREHDIRGPIATVTSGCNSGIDALGVALDWIRAGRADAVLVGGAEAELVPGFLHTMTSARALALRYNATPEIASRPFDTGRDGNVPGEGAGFLVLESAEHAGRRGRRIRAALEGFASRAVGVREPYDPFKPIFNPAPMVRAMNGALQDASLRPAEVSVVSANGSASVFYDPVEAMAIRELLGDRADAVPVHSVKSMLGQTGAATPALQAISAVLTIEHGIVPPTTNVDEIDPRCPITIVKGEPKRMTVDHVLANAIGFGGYYYASVVFGRA